MQAEISILLVEDDQVDIMTIKRVFKELNITNPVHVCENGLDALDYLHDPQTSLPCIILLDINMPKMNGIEFLQVKRDDELIKAIPVVVFTTSKEEQNKIESFKFGVAGYMVKPVDYQAFVDVIRTIHLYWTLSELP